MPNPAEKATFAAAAEPVQAWFTDNVDGRQRILSALKTAVAEDEVKIKADRAADVLLAQRRRLKHETAASYGSCRFLFNQVECCQHLLKAARYPLGHAHRETLFPKHQNAAPQWRHAFLA